MDNAALSFIEVSSTALSHNVSTFAKLADQQQLAIVVKANAYGHGLLPVAELALAAGASWLMVFDIAEAFTLRQAGITAPILVLGPTPAGALCQASQQDISLTVASVEAAAQLAEIKPGRLKLHLKLETGTNRQGLQSADFAAIRTYLDDDNLSLEGAYTHFADIEDTTDHSFALSQLDCFKKQMARLQQHGLRPSLCHTACSAATLLFADTYFDMVRVGISAYGLWPSKETLVSIRQSGRTAVELQPVMTWKTQIAQVKTAAAGETIGYGRSYKTTRDSRLAILPIGYSNGYDRHLSNQAHVLINGLRAPLRGRVMMNMIIVDVTDIPQAKAGDPVVLLGRQGNEVLSAETMAAWIGTINYEVVTRAEPHGPRVVVL